MREKRTNRIDVPKQLRVRPGLGQLVRRLADLEQRPIGTQMEILLTKGVEQYCRENGKEFQELFSQMLSGQVR